MLSNISYMESLPLDVKVKLFENFNFQELAHLAVTSKDCKAAVEEAARHIFTKYAEEGLTLKGRPVTFNPSCSYLSNLANLRKEIIAEVLANLPEEDSIFKSKCHPLSLSSCVPGNSNLLKIQQIEQQRSQKANREIFVLWDALTLNLKEQPPILEVENAHLFTKEEITLWLKDPKNKHELAKVEKLRSYWCKIKKIAN